MQTLLPLFYQICCLALIVVVALAVLFTVLHFIPGVNM